MITSSNILYGVGGVVIGSVATFLITKKINDKKVQNEVNDIRAAYRKAISDFLNAKNDKNDKNECENDEPSTEDASVEDKKALAEANRQRKADILEMNTISNRQNYNVFYNQMSEDQIDTDDDDDEYVKIVDATAPSEGLADEPYCISQEEFVAREPYYDKTTLNFYDDGILEEELTEEIIEDISATVGKDFVNKFGEYEDDVVFVRNDRLSTDFEIIRQHRNFAEIPD